MVIIKSIVLYNTLNTYIANNSQFLYLVLQSIQFYCLGQNKFQIPEKQGVSKEYKAPTGTCT